VLRTVAFKIAEQPAPLWRDRPDIRRAEQRKSRDQGEHRKIQF
jgi:hypothetical protein